MEGALVGGLVLAFVGLALHTLADARTLARAMVAIGSHAGRRVSAVEAERTGIANLVVPRADLDSAARREIGVRVAYDERFRAPIDGSFGVKGTADQLLPDLLTEGG